MSGTMMMKNDVVVLCCQMLYFLTIRLLFLPQEIKYAVHAHPTLSEVLDELFKSAKVILLTSMTLLWHFHTPNGMLVYLDPSFES